MTVMEKGPKPADVEVDTTKACLQTLKLKETSNSFSGVEIESPEIDFEDEEKDNEKLSVFSVYKNMKSLCRFETFKESHSFGKDTLKEIEIEASSIMQNELVAQAKEKLKSSLEYENVAALNNLADSFYLQTLRVRHWKVEHAVESLKRFIKFRRSQEWPLRADPVHSVLETNMQFVLPIQDNSGRNVVVVRYGELNLRAGSIKDFQLMTQFCLEKATANNPSSQRNGVALILDFSQCSFGMLRQSSIGDGKRGVNMFRFFPYKLKRCYIVNANRLIQGTIRSLSMLSTAAVKSKLTFVSSNFSELHSDISVKGLPTEYGGKLTEEWKKNW
eukprot:CAMPEP_0204839906 /NCGR_PEP_ID=MMETSP1346-20131115/35802_1 /ASSEMBLY_ACC=CAM_ASM_000771 /TAXON_ID=215587 /ORGANISM="Aplanochytrium stocchinoi, Strain GSBS06" /LENGTH=330 /DNA_ID=CAMNT_0051976975 /DNA_START=129 /DNA_END=1118 /DNA_ORIENTATION=+